MKLRKNSSEIEVTPVTILGIKHPTPKKDIQRLSEKLVKHTKGLDPCWPKEGTGKNKEICENLKDKKNKNRKKYADKQLPSTKVAGIYPSLSKMVQITGDTKLDDFKPSILQH